MTADKSDSDKPALAYRRILLKISGEALMGEQNYGIDVDVARMVSASRYHHQWWPDRVEIEPDGFPAEWRAALEAKGHRVETGRRRWGNMQAVFKSKQSGAVQSASDPRGTEVGSY